MTDKLNMKKVCAVDSYKYLGQSVYYSKPYENYSLEGYHPCCCNCKNMFTCPYIEALPKSKHAKDTLCMKYLFDNSAHNDLVYMKYHNDNSRRRFVLMSCGIPYEYDSTLQ